MAISATYDFRNKSKIITTFNSSQEHYNEYLKLKDCDEERAEDALNTSGIKLYLVFEWVMKYHLYNRYTELVGHGLSYGEADIKKRGLMKQSITINSIKYTIDTNYLCNEMRDYANPNPALTNINFSTIKINRWGVNNGQKHIALPVDEIKYQESFNEIRKLLLTYVDSNAPIQVQQSTEFNRLQEDLDYWKTNPKYNLCLIIDRSDEITEDDRQLITSIPWALVFDFDSNSNINGLANSFMKLKGFQPNQFDPLHPSNTKFNPMSTSPYWFFVNGRTDIASTLVSDRRQWKQKYGTRMPNCIEHYHKVFSKPLRVIIINGVSDRIQVILDALDTCYEDQMKISILSTEPQYESLTEVYSDEIMKKYPMTLTEFCNGLRNYSSLLGLNRKKEGYSIVGRDGKVTISLERFSHYELLFLGIADDKTEKQPRENFYQGRNVLSWQGIKENYAIVRMKHFKYVVDEITNRCKNVPYSIFRFYHDPGAGGTTLIRQAAYHLSLTNPVIIMKFFEEKSSCIQVGNLYDQVHMSIIIIAESTVLGEDEVQKFEEELKASSIPHVVVYVRRLSKRNIRKDINLSILNDNEFDEMYEILKNYASEEKLLKIKKMKVQPHNRLPFLMSLNTFDNDFVGVPHYITKFLSESDSYDKDILINIALLDQYADEAIPLNFFTIIEPSDEVGIFRNNINDALVTVEDERIKMRHPLFATEILAQTITGGRKTISDIEKGENLSKIVINFITCSKTNNFIDYDTTISILKNLLIIRSSDGLVKDNFSPIIEKIKDLLRNAPGEQRYNAIGRIFKTLENVYSDETHFKAHLSRFYTNIECSYIKGIDKAKEAVELAESFGVKDALLYHIYAISERKYVEQDLYSKVLKNLELEINSDSIMNDLQEHLSIASTLFSKTRELNHKSAGYISDIDMCINVVDFGKKYFDCTTIEFIEHHRDSWFMSYYDRAISLMESFNTMNADEDIEFQQNRLYDKYSNILQDMQDNIEKTISMWEKYLINADESSKPLARRFVARARRTVYLKDGDESQIDQILGLMEDNIAQEPTNEANIRIWFNALRYSSKDNPEIMLDNALSKLAMWKSIADNREAYYYYFILICIKSIEHSSRAESQIPILLNELREKTAYMPNKNVIYEWLGKGKGVKRLFNIYNDKKKHVNSVSYDEVLKNGEYLEGVVVKYSNERSALISSYGMEVFFTPSPTGQAPSVTAEDVGKRVRFIAGFSYDGVRALNKSVQIINDSENLDEHTFDIVGKLVKCTVIGIDPYRRYVNLKLCDYRNQLGSIKYDELEDGKTVDDYKKNDVFYAKVIGKKERNGRTYLSLSLKTDDLLDDWQQKLVHLTRDI